eukprot:7374796-Karenia_brevis.AAC.1
MPTRANVVKEHLAFPPPFCKGGIVGIATPGRGPKGQTAVPQCPGGTPQRDRPWLVPPGHKLQWGTHHILNTGPQGHKLQWYK